MMKKICYIVAMRAEAKPFIDYFGVELQEGFLAPLPCIVYKGMVEDGELYVVLNGEQHGSDLVGCEAASVATMAAISRIAPDIIVNSGTCGGFISEGADIGSVYIGSGVMFHDRRVPGDDEWGTQALGNYTLYDKSKELAIRLGIGMGKVTTGSSLDMQPCDLEIIKANGGQLKDMEAAAVAFVCSLYGVPCVLVKSVTDLCDGGEKTFEEFSRNLAHASEQLKEVNRRLVPELLKML